MLSVLWSFVRIMINCLQAFEITENYITTRGIKPSAFILNPVCFQSVVRMQTFYEFIKEHLYQDLVWSSSSKIH